MLSRERNQDLTFGDVREFSGIQFGDGTFLRLSAQLHFGRDAVFEVRPENGMKIRPAEERIF